MSLYIVVFVINFGGVCNIGLRVEGQWVDIVCVDQWVVSGYGLIFDLFYRCEYYLDY